MYPFSYTSCYLCKMHHFLVQDLVLHLHLVQFSMKLLVPRSFLAQKLLSQFAQPLLVLITESLYGLAIVLPVKKYK